MPRSLRRAFKLLVFFSLAKYGDLRGSPRCFRFGECSKLGARWLLTMRSLLPGHSNESRLSYREQKTAGDAERSPASDVSICEGAGNAVDRRRLRTLEICMGTNRLGANACLSKR